jgi:hypothetical protein
LSKTSFHDIIVQNFDADWSMEYSMFIGAAYNYWGSLGDKLLLPLRHYAVVKIEHCSSDKSPVCCGRLDGINQLR